MMKVKQGPKVYNMRSVYPADAVYVGRGSKFGNPYIMSKEKDRDTVCDAYEQHVMNSPKLLIRIKEELRDKNLVCWCAPKRCHADTLLRLANC